MNLNPTFRWLLGGVAAGVAAFGALLPTLTGVPTWVGVVVSVASAVFAALNIVPPAAGGTQEGIVKPNLKDENGAIDLMTVLIVLGIIVLVVVLISLVDVNVR